MSDRPKASLKRPIGRRLRAVMEAHGPMVWFVEPLVFICAGFGAFLLRFDLTIPSDRWEHLIWALAIWVTLKTVIFRIMGLDRGCWRYVTVVDIVRVGLGNLSSSVLSCVAIWMFAPKGFPRSICLIDLLLSLLGTAAARIVARMVSESAHQNPKGKERKATIIYGAGSAGVAALRELRQNSALPYHVVGFVDDDPRKCGLSIFGLRIYSGKDLDAVIKRFGVEMILIAIPSADGVAMIQILERCQKGGVAYKTMPTTADVLDGKPLASGIREVAVEDLLGRSPARLEMHRIRAKIEGRVVLVTGAAGSIGSELCRQVARFNPGAIVGFEAAETALFYLEREMRLRFPGVEFRAEIGNVQNPRRVADVFRKYKPAVIYHAAAYKHVPMMEAHQFEAVENNVFGSYNVAMAAAEYGVGDFVMISTDKAVRPTNVMGATKRFAERMVQSLQNGSTRYAAVRFGNVLGSNGSVIPIFREQIAAGGPVTVTHPEMQRFFMTIPEAAQLVLQASSMGRGGEIFVLDMGRPVKIVDLARNLILLSGLRPGVDIDIEFTGLRPGEKLYEELAAFEESTAATEHEKIKSFLAPTAPWEEIAGGLARLRDLCERRDRFGLVLWLKECVPEYNPSAHLLREAMSGEEEAIAIGRTPGLPKRQAAG
jgi:FlaA1/EpsC-like NDP-sugar epimerase